MKNISDEKMCIDKLSKLGTSPFIAGDIKIVIKGDVFIPSSQLNDIRRDDLIFTGKATFFASSDNSPICSRFHKDDFLAKQKVIEAVPGRTNNYVISVPNRIACNALLTIDKSVFFQEIYVDYINS